MSEYSKTSVELTKKLSSSEKKEGGVYLTPGEDVDMMLKVVAPFLSDVSYSSILEPSCGSCEIVDKIVEKYGKTVEMNEKNEMIYEEIKKKYTNATNEDFLAMDVDKKYDMVVGNPPFFVMKKGDVPEQYHKYFDGRPNIFIIFIAKTLEILREGGVMSYILPSSFMNCSYYEKMRKYINDTCQVIDVVECKGKYLETAQSTIVFVVRKTNGNNTRYFVNGSFFPKANVKILKRLLKKSTTLNKLGYEVRIGTVVWNQEKSLLTDDESKTRLIYSGDIKGGILGKQVSKNPEKKHYIDMKGERGAFLLVNRGYGVGEYVFSTCLVNVEYDILVENHVMWIRGELEVLERIKRSFDDPRTKEFLDIYSQNSALNSTEITKILPIYNFSQ